MDDLKNRACSAEVPTANRRPGRVLAVPAASRAAAKMEWDRALARAREQRLIPSLHPAPELLRSPTESPRRGRGRSK